jgi:hypothetical protein
MVHFASALARLGEMPPADTRRAIQPSNLAIGRSDHVKCLHALSSFQRTGSPTKSRRLRCTAALHSEPRRGSHVFNPKGPFLGEPFKTTGRTNPCQALISLAGDRPVNWTRPTCKLANPEGARRFWRLRAATLGSARTRSVRVATTQRTYES